MAKKGLDLSAVRAVSVSGQQHGTVYWAKGAGDRLEEVARTMGDESSPKGGVMGDAGLPSIPDSLAGCFAVENSPIWADGSTEEYAHELERTLGGAERLAALTGSRAHLRQGASQIMKVQSGQ